jgi:hypothetical protein
MRDAPLTQAKRHRHLPDQIHLRWTRKSVRHSQVAI